MAIYHMTTKPVSRSSGRTATASSAYRAGVELKDERTGRTFDYSKRLGVLFAQAFDKDRIEIDRSQLWNLAEQSEKRKDARTAREYIIAIPFELIPKNENDKKDFRRNLGAQVAFEFAQEIAKKYDVAVDIAIHAPDAEGDNRNYHAHILTTTRKFERTANGINLTDKSNIELSNKKLNELNLPKTQDQVKSLRELWADTANKYLDNEQKIDHRSYAEQGKDQLPTIKLGWKASALERKGIKTDRGDINRAIISDNQKLLELKEEVSQLKKAEIERLKQAEIQRLKEVELEQKRQAEIERLKQAEIERLKEAEIQKHMVDIEVPAPKVDLEIARIENRKTVDLLDLKLKITIKDEDKSYARGTIYKQDIVSIDGTYYKALQTALYNEKQFVVEDASKHLNKNQTALNIKRFLFSDIKDDSKLNVSRINDYHNLKVKDFVEKYDISYSSEDLKELDSIKPEPSQSPRSSSSNTQHKYNDHEHNHNNFNP